MPPADGLDDVRVRGQPVHDGPGPRQRPASGFHGHRTAPPRLRPLAGFRGPLPRGHRHRHPQSARLPPHPGPRRQGPGPVGRRRTDLRCLRRSRCRPRPAQRLPTGRPVLTPEPEPESSGTPGPSANMRKPARNCAASPTPSPPPVTRSGTSLVRVEARSPCPWRRRGRAGLPDGRGGGESLARVRQSYGPVESPPPPGSGPGW